MSAFSLSVVIVCRHSSLLAVYTSAISHFYQSRCTFCFQEVDNCRSLVKVTVQCAVPTPFRTTVNRAFIVSDAKQDRWSSTIMLWCDTILSVCMEWGAKAEIHTNTFLTIPEDTGSIFRRQTDSEHPVSLYLLVYARQTVPLLTCVIGKVFLFSRIDLFT